MSATRASSCPECDGRLNERGDETVCADCGLVVDADRLDRGPEWRSLADDGDQPERTGAPLTRSRHDRGLTTEGGNHGDTLRLRRQQRRTAIRSKAERNQVYGFTEIRRVVDALGLPDSVRDAACRLFESAQDADLMRGRSLEGFAAAAVYAVCRSRSVSCSVTEVTVHAKADRGELRAACDALSRDLGLPTGPVHPREFVPRVASELDCPPAVERAARQVTEHARETGIDVGRNPCGVAAACVYLGAERVGYELTQAAVADVADVTPVTVRSAYYDLQE